nr:nucleotidyl transferase AbiEii/AbiGii toxin family protein [Longispora albida]
MHERIARVALAATEQYGFCLAGGYAVEAHGMVRRVSEDVDLFTVAAAEDQFPAAVEAVVSALTSVGFDVEIEQQSPSFARVYAVELSSGTRSKLELGIDWRSRQPVRRAVGPVLHPVDAVANKMCALYGRGAVRDYIDVHGALVSGVFTPEELIRFAQEHDPGFDPLFFAEVLDAVQRLPASAFATYDLDVDAAALLRARLLGWAAALRGLSG